MNDQADFLERLVDKLKASGIPFMLVGSAASSFHGRPRATFDIDLVVDGDEETLAGFAQSLGEGYYVDEQSVRRAVRSRSIFNVVDEISGYKADFIVRKDRPFSRLEFERRIRVKILNRSMDMATAEDVILSKLEWSRSGASERQFEDAFFVTKSQWDQLDADYLDKWSRELGVYDLWMKIRDRIRSRS